MFLSRYLFPRGLTRFQNTRGILSHTHTPIISGPLVRPAKFFFFSLCSFFSLLYLYFLQPPLFNSTLRLSVPLFTPSLSQSLSFLKGAVKLCKAFPSGLPSIFPSCRQAPTLLMRLAAETQQLPSLISDKLIMRGTDSLEHQFCNI